MKYFIFTCLVAVALAKHVVKDQSIEESARIHHRKNAQDKDVIFQTVQDSASSSSSEESSEEINDKIVQTEKQKVNLNEQKKIKQFSQDLPCPQFCMPVAQQQSDMNQWVQGKTVHNIPNQESINIIMKETLKKIIDMIKSNQIQQFNTPHFPQITHLQPIPATYWNIHKYYTSRYAPYMV